MRFPRPDEINRKLWYGVSQAAFLLGIDRKTVSSRAAMGALYGGLDFRINKGNGRKEFKGEELLRYLHGLQPEPKLPKRINRS